MQLDAQLERLYWFVFPVDNAHCFIQLHNLLAFTTWLTLHPLSLFSLVALFLQLPMDGCDVISIVISRWPCVLEAFQLLLWLA
jgi:hypothetical protein